MADGSLVTASPQENNDLFHAVIGGYGGIGVIVEATLNLVPNERIRREIVGTDIASYQQFFAEKIRENKDAVLHNGDLLPPDYDYVNAETWYRTNQALTNEDRLQEKGKNYWIESTVITMIASLPFGSEIRKYLVDPWLRKDKPVVWRNYEASYDLATLEPLTPRILFTYVLQEYFVPVDGFAAFVSGMKRILRKHDVNVINVSIRYALPDPWSFLAWAPEEVFSFVIYYRQRTSEGVREEVGIWTKDLIDHALSLGGRYYLPYQIHATKEQFQRAYPGFERFFEVKRKFDPTNKFRNRLWDSYFQ